jgi:integrase
MSPCQRKGSPFWYVRRYIAGLGELRLSTATKNAALARRYDQLVLDLKDLGRYDALQGLESGRVTLRELYANKLPSKLDALIARKESLTLRPLVQEWLSVGAQDTGIRDRSMARYASSWRRLFELLPDSARVGDLTQGFVSEFKRHRLGHAKTLGRPLSPATLNRDLAALGAFLSWCREDKGMRVERPNLRYQRESKGRTRWLPTEELDAFRAACSPEWWPLFGLLFGTGMTISEALGLRRTDLDLRARRVSIHEEYGRRLKRESRTRELSIPEPLVLVLAGWLASRVAPEPTARIFGFTYWPARKAWAATCIRAGIHGATIHDARHTFAVHAVQNGVPEARLQKLLGHAHPGTTRRYAMHAPEQFLAEDAETVARSMGLAGSARVMRMVEITTESDLVSEGREHKTS